MMLDDPEAFGGVRRMVLPLHHSSVTPPSVISRFSAPEDSLATPCMSGDRPLQTDGGRKI